MSNRENDLERSKEQWYRTATRDVDVLCDKETQYKGSWKRRGGTGAYENLCRKWDRIEAAVAEYGNNIFMAAAGDERHESILDDIGDLRRYLMLVEAELNLIKEDGESERKAPSKRDLHRMASAFRPRPGEEGDYELPVVSEETHTPLYHSLVHDVEGEVKTLRGFFEGLRDDHLRLCERVGALESQMEVRVQSANLNHGRVQTLINQVGDLKNKITQKLDEAEVAFRTSRPAEVADCECEHPGDRARSSVSVQYQIPRDYRSPGYRMPEGEMSDIEDLTQDDIDEIRRQAANHARAGGQHATAQTHDPGLNIAHEACMGEIEDLKERITNLNRALLSEENVARETQEKWLQSESKIGSMTSALLMLAAQLTWWIRTGESDEEQREGRRGIARNLIRRARAMAEDRE